VCSFGAFILEGKTMRLVKATFLVGVLFHGTVSLAQVTPADQQRAVDQLQDTQQQQEMLLKQLERDYESTIREKAKPQIDIKRPEAKQIPPGRCFDIQTITLKDADHLSDDEKADLTTPYINQCIGVAEIDNLMRDVTNYYMDRGYVTTRAVISPQGIKDGTLELLVLEGKIEEIILNDNTWRDQLQVQTAFPFLKGKILNLRDIEQGLDQINRLASSNATMELAPGSKDGYSRIIITNEITNPNHISSQYSNMGQSSTGKNLLMHSYQRDNLFGLGEHLSITHSGDTADDSGIQKNKMIQGSLSIPFGYWTLSFDGGHSEYVTTINGTNQSFTSSGETDSFNTTLNRVVHRNQDSKTSADIGFLHKNTIALIEGSELTNGATRALSILKLGADNTYRGWGSIFYNAIGYQRGLDVFGARKDGDNLTHTNPRAQFDKFTVDSSVYKPFVVMDQSFAYRLQASGQYSSDPLFSSEQISVGGRYTVPGFQEESIAGDTGGYVRANVHWDAIEFSDNRYTRGLIGTLQPYTALAGGWTRIRGGKDTNATGEAYISGWSVGLRNNAEWLEFDVGYAEQIKRPGFFTSEDDYEVYFSVMAKFGF
jgi:hemolysin activation/secretion protein